jgi:hypothetical protein
VVRLWAKEKVIFLSVAPCRTTLLQRAKLFDREDDTMTYMQCRVYECSELYLHFFFTSAWYDSSCRPVACMIKFATPLSLSRDLNSRLL